MTVLIKILSIIGVLLLIVIGLLLWLAVVPRHFWVEYSKIDGLVAKMNIAFFKVRLYPLPQFVTKKGKKDNRKTPSETKRDKPAEKENNILKELNYSFDLVKQILDGVKGLMQRVFGAIKFTDVSFTLPVYAGEPHKTQQAYGVVTNGFYALSMLLQKYMQITFRSPLIVADFADTYGDAVYFYTQITASPIMLLTAAYYGYTQYKEITENNKKTGEITVQTTETVAEKESENG